MGKPKVTDTDHGWRDILKTAVELGEGSFTKVGILGGSEDRGGLHQTDPTTGKSAPLTIAEIALVNEYGTEDGHIPARPAHRMTFDTMRAELAEDSRKLLIKVVLDRTMTVEQALNILGLKLATGIKRAITSGAGVPPPNAPSTARAKVPASSTGAKRQKAIDGARPLVDTGATLNAISWATFLGTVRASTRYLTGKK